MIKDKQYFDDNGCTKRREFEWKLVFERRMHQQPKYIWKHINEYFFDGNVEKFIKGELKSRKKQGFRPENIIPSIYDSVAYAPINRSDDFFDILDTVFEWYDSNEGKYSERFFEAERNAFLESIPELSKRFKVGFDSKLCDELFFNIYGLKFDNSRVLPVSLGKKKWQPVLVGYNSIIHNIIEGVANYLFVKDVDVYYGELGVEKYKNEKYFDFFSSFTPHIDPEFYSTDIKSIKHFSSLGNRIYPMQLTYRRFLMGLMGHNDHSFSKSEDFFCRDPDLMKKYKEDFLSKKASKELQNLIHFIEKNGDKSYRKSEKP